MTERRNPERAALKDSSEATRNHIDKVRSYLYRCMTELTRRAADHDRSKLGPIEKPLFDEYTPKLHGTTYGSDQYKEYQKALKPALDHHYATYRHHPEHFETGYREMNLIDVLEMLCDWKAATQRQEDGDLERSIEINAKRFGYGPEFQRLLWNTANDMGWL